MLLALAPNSIIASTVLLAMRIFVPFHPAWAAPIIPATGSTSTMGTQSAVLMPITVPGSVVTSASNPSRFRFDELFSLIIATL